MLGSYFHRSVFNRIRSADNAALKYGRNFLPDDRRGHSAPPLSLVEAAPGYIRPRRGHSDLYGSIFDSIRAADVSFRQCKSETRARINGCLPFNLCTVHFRSSQGAIPRVPGETGKIMSAAPGTSGDGEPPVERSDARSKSSRVWLRGNAHEISIRIH